MHQELVLLSCGSEQPRSVCVVSQNLTWLDGVNASHFGVETVAKAQPHGVKMPVEERGAQLLTINYWNVHAQQLLSQSTDVSTLR